MIQSSSLSAQHLSDFRWKHRILVLSYNETETSELKTAFKLLESHKVDIKQRDILVCTYKQQQLYTLEGHEITNSSILPKYFKGYILIGKDGGVKAKESYPLELEGLLNLIDSMPMRRAEMNKNN